MPTPCDISISTLLEIRVLQDWLEQIIMHPARAFCYAALKRRCPPGPLKATGPLEFICEHWSPSWSCKLFLPYAESLFTFLMASRDFESCIIHTHSYAGERIIAQPVLYNTCSNELVERGITVCVCPRSAVACRPAGRNYRTTGAQLAATATGWCSGSGWELLWAVVKSAPAFSPEPREGGTPALSEASSC